MNDEAHHAYRIKREAARRRAGRPVRRGVRRRGRRRGLLQGGDRLDRRAGPHPQAARHQRLHRPVGDAVLPWPGRAGDEPAVPVGRERLRPDRRHRVGPGQDSAARRPRHDRGGDPGLLQHLALDLAQADPGRAGRQAGQSEAGGDPQVGAHPDRHAGRPLGGHDRGMGQGEASHARRSSSWSARTRRSPRSSTSGSPRTRPRRASRPSRSRRSATATGR